jgi:hypothetical protein
MPTWSGHVEIRLGLGDHTHLVRELAATTLARAAAVAAQAGIDAAREVLFRGVSAGKLLGPEGEAYEITLSLTRDGA